MSDEMVMPTSDSPAGATDGMSAAFASFVQDNAGPGSDAQGATSAEQTTTPEFDVDILLGVEQQPANVPYERFKEVNDQRKASEGSASEYNQWKDVIDQFKQQGFNNAAEIQKAIQQQELMNEEQSIRTRYEQLHEANVLDSNTAYIQQEAEIQKLRYDRQLAEMQQYMAVHQSTEALKQFPLAEKAQDLMQSLVNNGFTPTAAAEIAHNQVKSIAKSLLPQLTTKLRAEAPTPMSNGQSAAQPRAPQAMGGLSALTQLMGISRNSNSL
jgi:hypothetical protein